MIETLLADAALPDGRRLELVVPTADRAGEIAELIHAAFAARRPVSPPPAALTETAQTVADKLEHGILAQIDGRAAGVILVSIEPDDSGSHAFVQRVSVHPDFQRLGIASAMIDVLFDELPELGVNAVELDVRPEFPELLSWWSNRGFEAVGKDGSSMRLRGPVAAVYRIPTAEEMQSFGKRLAKKLKAGDLLIASGELGAGKTTLTQGIGEGLDVQGQVISPTFVLSRVHPSNHGGPALVHVDAYRLGSFAELEDIDLEASLSDSVTLVEWGEGIAEGLSDERLEIDIKRSQDPNDDTRWVFLTPIGKRWREAELENI
ncbi:MAG: tRNA (adenosine(37)-N6)-threonylcarbamoyltransferase complex ATPase subunit type 1 TsaE [Propionibacteriaceae bacterium]|jgi:tRNA threonylcarbamoyladenosine biosynthesis protein TsaE|nr:tRNA (adenosine(37)-N6)-threonylcarbamoyltransferase complex ATPase subunit type 1 TsaE [Propionibacteriaceae bacterium]